MSKTLLKVPQQGEQRTRLFPKRGEIWLVKFPKAKEDRKPFRPCIVISNNKQNKYDEEWTGEIYQMVKIEISDWERIWKKI